jgi:hypothetical protein
MSENALFKLPVIKVHNVYTKPRTQKHRGKRSPVVFACDLTILAVRSGREGRPPNLSQHVEAISQSTPSKHSTTHLPHNQKPNTLKKLVLKPEFPTLQCPHHRMVPLAAKPKSPKIKRDLSHKVVPVSPLSNLLLKLNTNSTTTNFLSPWSGATSRNLTSKRSRYTLKSMKSSQSLLSSDKKLLGEGVDGKAY